MITDFTSKNIMQVQLVQHIIDTLEMTQQDLSLFIAPSVLYKKFERGVIYDLNKSQIDLFMNIAKFSKVDKTVDQR